MVVSVIKPTCPRNMCTFPNKVNPVNVGVMLASVAPPGRSAGGRL